MDMSFKILKQFKESIDNLEQAVLAAYQAFEKQKDAKNYILPRLEGYIKVIQHQKTIPSQLEHFLVEQKYDDFNRLLKISQAMSEMIRLDSQDLALYLKGESMAVDQDNLH